MRYWNRIGETSNTEMEGCLFSTRKQFSPREGTLDKIWKKPRTLYKVNCHTGHIGQAEIYGERVEKGYGRTGWKVAARDKEGTYS